MEKEPEGKTSKHRSPNYPSIPLDVAVEKVGVLYKEDGKFGSDTETAMRHLGYSSVSGPARTVMSALRKFGLIEYQAGRTVPTAQALDILVYTPGQPQYEAAVKEAALAPDIYRLLWEQYAPGGRLPSDLSIKQHLIRGLDFNPKSVDGFLSDFKSTMEWAGLLDGNRVVVSQEEQAPEPPALVATAHAHRDVQGPAIQGETMTAAAQPQSVPPSMPMGGRLLSVPLSHERQAVISVPSDLGVRDVRVLKDYLDFVERTLLNTEPTVRLGPAFWKTQVFDYPIVVAGYLGFDRGKHYVRIDGSDTGVPMDEIVYPEELEGI
jgi:hypothetical protein